MLWRSRPEAEKRADREARLRAPDRRMVETPSGTLTIQLQWLKWAGKGVVAYMTLYGADGWNAERREWLEQFGANPERDKDGVTLAQFISEWTGMPPVGAEAFAEETVSRWRRSSAYEEDAETARQGKQVMVGLAAVVVLALVGVTALVWLIVSALT